MKKVIYCDDQPEIHIAGAMQQAQCDFLGKCSSPRELFSTLHQGKIPDILFLDARFNTRQIDQNFGELRETLEELRAYEQWRFIKIVVLTGVPIRELFNLAYPFIDGFIDKADYQCAVPDAITVFTFGDEDATFFNKFSPWKPKTQIAEIWSNFTELQRSILDDLLRGHSDEFIQVKHGMRNHSNLSGRIDHILARLMELSARKDYFAGFGDMARGGLSIRQKFWIILQVCIELRHPVAMAMLEKNGLKIGTEVK
jgi:DNA-binding NarL/FixJ family response regulator